MCEVEGGTRGTRDEESEKMNKLLKNGCRRRSHTGPIFIKVFLIHLRVAEGGGGCYALSR